VESARALRPGEIDVDATAGVLVGAGDGALRLERLQAAGEDEAGAREWAERSGVHSGDVLGKGS
jgi:methionyl-tRNA formyltransferase